MNASRLRSMPRPGRSGNKRCPSTMASGSSTRSRFGAVCSVGELLSAVFNRIPRREWRAAGAACRVHFSNSIQVFICHNAHKCKRASQVSFDSGDLHALFPFDWRFGAGFCTEKMFGYIKRSSSGPVNSHMCPEGFQSLITFRKCGEPARAQFANIQRFEIQSPRKCRESARVGSRTR